MIEIEVPVREVGPMGLQLPRRMLVEFGVIVIVICALSFLVGHFAAADDKGFDWEVTSIFGTAVGTLLLAFAALALAGRPQSWLNKRRQMFVRHSS
jgi:uncharacterized membrane protein